MSKQEMAAMVGDCYWSGLLSSTEAMEVLADAAGIDRGEAAGLLLSHPAPPRTDDPRDDDGSWIS